MNVKELNKEQLIQLKQNYYIIQHENDIEGISWGELSNIDELVRDDEVIEAYKNIDFVEDDF